MVGIGAWNYGSLLIKHCSQKISPGFQSYSPCYHMQEFKCQCLLKLAWAIAENHLGDDPLKKKDLQFSSKIIKAPSMDEIVDGIYFSIFLCLGGAIQFSGKIIKFRIQIWSKHVHILIVIWHEWNNISGSLLPHSKLWALKLRAPRIAVSIKYDNLCKRISLLLAMLSMLSITCSL